MQERIEKLETEVKFMKEEIQNLNEEKPVDIEKHLKDILTGKAQLKLKVDLSKMKKDRAVFVYKQYRKKIIAEQLKLRK